MGDRAGLESVAARAGAGAIHLLRRAPSPSDVLAQEAFKLLAAFLRTCPAYQPSTAQVGQLLPCLPLLLSAAKVHDCELQAVIHVMLQGAQLPACLPMICKPVPTL